MAFPADLGRTSVTTGPTSVGGAGVPGDLDYRVLRVGDPAATPVSTAASGNPGHFQHRPPATLRRGDTGNIYGLTRSVFGAADAAATAPSPDAPSHVVDFLSEPRATFAKLSRNLELPLMTGNQVDQIMFTEVLRSIDPVMRRRGADARRYTMLNVVALNYILAMQRVPQTPGARVPNAALEVMETWPFEGIVLTETGKEETFNKNEVGAERGFNCVVRGPAHTYNVFGEHVRCGTPLYIIVKKERVDKRKYVVNPGAGGLDPHVSDKDATHAFQVSFFGHQEYRTPPLSKLRYIDEHGIPAYGSYRRIGVAGNNTSPFIPDEYIAQAPHNIGAILACPKMNILTDQGSW